MLYIMGAQDEFMHQPTSELHFNESVYTNGFDSQTGVGGWMRLGNRVNEGYAELSICLYLPDGRIACQFQRPNIDNNDRFSAAGLSYTVKQPLNEVEMTYDGELLILNDPDLLRSPRSMAEQATRVPGAVHFSHTAASPVRGGLPSAADQEPMYGWDFSLGHFNQHTRVHGEISIAAETFRIDGAGWRDHSWGPRLWQNIHHYRLFMANLGQGRGFMLLKITDPHRRTRRLGVLLVDGAYEEIQDLDVSTKWTSARDPMAVQLGVRTAQRSVIITGDVIQLAPLRNRRQIDGQMVTTRIAEGHTRFTWDDVVGYGMTEYIERLDGDRLVGYPL